VTYSEDRIRELLETEEKHKANVACVEQIEKDLNLLSIEEHTYFNKQGVATQ